MQAANRIPPQDLNAEKALLGAMLMAQSVDGLDWSIDDVAAILPGAVAFYLSDHRVVYDVLLDAHGSNVPIDLIAVGPMLQAKCQRDGTFWQDFTIELAESFADVANGPFYARRVRDCWRRREVITVTGTAGARAYDPLVEVDDTLVDLAKDVDRIEGTTAADSSGQRVSAILAALDAETASERIPIIPSSLAYRLDGGLALGTLTVVGARPSCGKTSWLLGLCANAERRGFPAMLVSAEMNATSVGERIRTMQGHARGADFIVVDTVREVHDIGAIVRHHARRNGVKLAALDYLGLLDIRGRYDRHDLRLGAMTAALKRLAMEANIAVVLACQLNRQSANEQRAPRLSDLRDSGSIEQDADVVLLLNPSSIVGDADIVPTDIIVAKNRQGRTGVVTVSYDRTRFAYQDADSVRVDVPRDNGRLKLASEGVPF